MYTVLLVDDEESVLDILKRTIDWQEMGVDTLLTASDGNMALKKIEQCTVDLIITDICMPGMDGIELIRQARIRQKEIHCILLTAYGEFQYAQEAIRLGVDNYLLKPVIGEEVSQTIRSALDNIYQKRQSSENFLRENTLRRWIGGNISAEELGERAFAIGINLYFPAYVALCMVSSGGDSMSEARTTILKLLKKELQYEGVWDEKGRYVFIIGGKALDVDALIQQIYTDDGYQAMCGKIRLAFGTVVTQYELIQISYQTACDALETVSVSKEQVIVNLDDDIQSFDTDLLAEECRILLFDMQNKNSDSGFRHMAHKLYKKGWNEKIFSKVCRACVHVLNQEFPNQNSLQEKIYLASEQIVRPIDVESGNAAVVELLQRVKIIFEEAFAIYTPMVQHMLRYIRSGVLAGNGVSIKILAAGSGVTPAYLGHMFKKETGMFFNDYLLKCRLERSIVLMRNPNRKVKDIAEIVGFSSTSYFIKCFREYRGISPAKYRMILMEENEDRK